MKNEVFISKWHISDYSGRRSDVALAGNVPSLCDVAKFVTGVFRLQINVMRTVNVNLLHNLQ
jgi:hypothetical protein